MFHSAREIGETSATKGGRTMPGPPPTPTILKLMKGNPGKRRLHPEPQPTIPEKCPEPPPHVTGYAADEWWTVGPGLHRLGLLTRADLPAFSCYCFAFGQWRLACEALSQMAERDQTMHGLLVKSVGGDAKRNPLIKLARDLAGDVVRYSGEFGLTPIARARLGAAGYAPPPPLSKFDGLLGSVLPMKRGDE
jgi:P27 family predicted phage terminase small subunit